MTVHRYRPSRSRITTGRSVGCALAVLLLAALAVAQDPPDAASGEEPAPRTKREIEGLMNEGLPFAEKMLAEHGEFLPFGAVKVDQGPFRIVGAYDEHAQLTPEEMLDLLFDNLRQGAQRREYSAAAVFANVQVPRPSDGESVDAVFIGLEHLDGYCVDVFFPYVVRDGEVEIGESFAGKREGSIFGSCR